MGFYYNLFDCEREEKLHLNAGNPAELPIRAHHMMIIFQYQLSYRYYSPVSGLDSSGLPDAVSRHQLSIGGNVPIASTSSDANRWMDPLQCHWFVASRRLWILEDFLLLTAPDLSSSSSSSSSSSTTLLYSNLNPYPRDFPSLLVRISWWTGMKQMGCFSLGSLTPCARHCLFSSYLSILAQPYLQCTSFWTQTTRGLISSFYIVPPFFRCVSISSTFPSQLVGPSLTDTYRASVDHGMSYIFWKLYRIPSFY